MFQRCSKPAATHTCIIYLSHSGLPVYVLLMICFVFILVSVAGY